MGIPFQCPGCGKKYSAPEGSAGRQLTCKQCGETTRVPDAQAEAPKPQTIPVRCEGCGKTFHVPLSAAGKKGTCKACGQSIRVPEAAMAVSQRPAAKAPAPMPAAPAPADIYGFDEEPVAAKSGASSVVELDARSGPDEGEMLPTRVGAETMSAAKKKQVAKRAAKTDRMRPSFAGAGMGASFGSILVVALIGWRVYRVVHRVGRIAGHVAVVGAADSDDVPTAEARRTMAAELDKDVEEMIRQPGTAEAREWLDPATFPNHGVQDMEIGKARAMVAGFYERGAEKVYVLEPKTVGDKLIAAQIAVKLPSDPAQRKKCFAWGATSTDGQGTTDDGEKYLVMGAE